MTGLYLVTRAMKKINALPRSADAPLAAEAQDGLDTLNHMVDAWGLKKWLLWGDLIERQTFPASQLSYTFGPTGSGANLITAQPVRPNRILQMNIVMTSVSPEVHIPITLLTRREYLGIPVPLINTTIPVRAYFDHQFVSTPGTNGASATAGIATLYMNPYPAAPLPDCEWVSRQQITQFDLTTDYAFPQGYAEALEWSLAERMFEFAPPDLNREYVTQMAREARAVLASGNADEPPRTSPDFGFGHGANADFNWITGNLE